MPRRRITRLTNRALKSGDLTDAFRHTGFAEAVERGLASPRSLVRAAARLALAVDAVVLPFVRHLREQAGRLPFFTDAASYSPHRILRRGLLTYSAALMAIGAGVAVGLVPGRSDLDLAAGRSARAVATAAAAGHGGSMRADTRGAGPLPATSSSAPSSASVGAPSSAAAAPDPATPPSLQLPLPPPIYVNPLARVANLRPERIDEGVDYAGAGALLALGSGIIRVTSEAGWPGNTFIALQLDKGQLAGRIIYYAENITPTVRVGQHVNAGDVVGILHDAYPNLEIGWAGGGNMGGTLGDALARSHGGDREGVSTAAGVNFNQVLVLLGAPGGIQQGLMGTVPSG